MDKKRRQPARPAPPADQGHLPLGPDWEPKPIPMPKDLVVMEDKDIEQLWAELRPQQQAFLIVFLDTGNRAEAYRQAYNPAASDHLASVSGSRMLASLGISKILEKLNEQKAAALHVATQVYFDMAAATKPAIKKDRKTGKYVNLGSVPDWKARKDGADGLCRIFDNNAPTRAEVTGKGGKPLFPLQNLTDEQIEQKLAALFKELGVAPTPGGEGPAEANAEN